VARPVANPNRAEEIIVAADELFARYGYERTSMEDIAKHLGIGKGSIYLDFRTKEEILFTILERHADAIQAALRVQILANDSSPLNILREALINDPLNCYDAVMRDNHSPETLLHSSVAMKKHFSHFFITRRGLIHMLLVRAAKAGEIDRQKATEDTARGLMMIVSSLYPPYLDNYSEAVTIKTRQDIIATAPILVDLVLAGLRTGASGS
jgi:AcrR family transcriptional regulator